VRMKALVFKSSSRKTVSNPTEKKPTTGQKRISKRVKKLRFVMIQFL